MVKAGSIASLFVVIRDEAARLWSLFLDCIYVKS